MPEALMAYFAYAEVVRTSATTLCAVYAHEIAEQNFRQTRRTGD